jgi:hypothetical protein
VVPDGAGDGVPDCAGGDRKEGRKGWEGWKDGRKGWKGIRE